MDGLNPAGRSDAAVEPADGVTRRLDELAGALRAEYERTGAMPGLRIGPYKLLSLLGEGGFGEVWLAERREPFAQRVAIKLIKPGMDTRAVLARFEQERQALAVMDHPNIARVLDGGATDSGRPYFVMELVHGESITKFCDRHIHTVRQRLELMAEVCDAVQHAHHKGIIHRDIKPSNILVSLAESRPVIKVIDFGVAKAISQTMTDKTIITEQGRFIGTPEYMSPEQAEMGAVDVDTRTDVYSLGVVLYELISGLLPFDPASLRSGGYETIRRIIREQDPPKPSTRLTSVEAEAGAAIARNRQSPRDALGRELRRELDWIPLKALRKDRRERYRSPSELADDIRRYLRGEALVAGPESAGYRLGKFMRRKRGAVAAAGAIAVTLVAATAVSAWFAMRAVRDRDRAQAAEARAQARADDLQKVSDFQGSMLAQVDPAEAGEVLSRDVAARINEALAKAGVSADEREREADEFAVSWRKINATDVARELIDQTILRPSLEAIDKQFADQPVVAAHLRQVLADRYRELGSYDQAMPLQASALETRQRVLGAEHRDTLVSVNGMGVLLKAQGKLAEAHEFTDRALAARTRTLGREHADSVESITNMGALLRAMGKLAEAEPFYQEALAIRRRTLGPEHQFTLTSVSNMGSLLRALGRNAEAEPLYEQSLRLRRQTLGNDHPDTLNSVNNMASLLQALGRLEEAEPLYVESLDTLRRTLGSLHPRTLIAMNNLAFLRQAQGKLEDAETLYREALEANLRTLGREHPSTLAFTRNLAIVLRARESHGEALELLKQAEPAARKVFAGGNARNLGVFLLTMGQVQSDLKRLAEAEKTLLEAHPLLEKGTPPSVKQVRECAQALAEVYVAWDAAEPGRGYDVKAAAWKARLDEGAGAGLSNTR